MEGELKKRMKKEKEMHKKTLETTLKEFSDTINDHYQEISLLLLKGCFISNQSYKKLRLLLSFNVEQERAAIIIRCNLPKIVKASLNSMYDK